MTFDQILSDLKNKVYHPVYFLMGDEPYYIDEISDLFANNVLDENEREFNQTIIYGRDTDAALIIEHARRFPMMSNHQVVIVREAQDIDKIELLLPYIENPLRSTILVLCYKYDKIDGRTKFGKTISQKAVLFESKKLYDNQVPEWVSRFLLTRNYKIQPKAAMMLTEFLGSDLGKIVNELNKLMLNLKPGTEIIPEYIEQNIGISKDFNMFELTNALGKKDVYKANLIAQHFAKNAKEHPLVVTMTQIYSFFSKLLIYHFLSDKSQKNVASILSVNPYFVRDYQGSSRNYDIKKIVGIISYLREYDRRSKGIGDNGTPEGELLRELVFKILH